MDDLKGKVALVTGGSLGIGQATALEFAAHGTKVVIASRRPAEGEQTVQMIKDAGGEGFDVKCDVSQAEQIKAMVDKTVKVYGRLDYAVNNAGSAGGDKLLLADTQKEVWDRTIDINGYIRVSQQVKRD